MVFHKNNSYVTSISRATIKETICLNYYKFNLIWYNSIQAIQQGIRNLKVLSLKYIYIIILEGWCIIRSVFPEFAQNLANSYGIRRFTRTEYLYLARTKYKLSWIIDSVKFNQYHFDNFFLKKSTKLLTENRPIIIHYVFIKPTWCGQGQQSYVWKKVSLNNHFLSSHHYLSSLIRIQPWSPSLLHLFGNCLFLGYFCMCHKWISLLRQFCNFY